MRRLLCLVVVLAALLLSGRAEAQNDAIRYYPPAGVSGLSGSGTVITSTLPLRLPSGTGALPSLSYTSEVGMGLWYAGVNKLGVSIGGFSYYTFEGDALHIGQTAGIRFSSGAPESVSADVSLIRAEAGVLTVTDGLNTNPGAFQIKSANGAYIRQFSISELLTLNTGATTTVTVANLAPANTIIDSIVYRVTTTITTAVNFTIKVTGGNVFNSIGTATSAQTGVAAGSTGILVPNLHGDQYNAAATTLTVTTNANPGAGAIRLTVFYRLLAAPSS